MIVVVYFKAICGGMKKNIKTMKNIILKKLNSESCVQIKYTHFCVILV